MNQDQPILGFDGWGFYNSSEFGHMLALVQVKTTDEARCPPREAYKLAAECKSIPSQTRKITRALSVLAIFLKDTNYQIAILSMLEKLGNGEELSLVIAPVIIRGQTNAHIDDMTPIQIESRKIINGQFKGLTMSIGVDLNEFGTAVMTRARSQT